MGFWLRPHDKLQPALSHVGTGMDHYICAQLPPPLGQHYKQDAKHAYHGHTLPSLICVKEARPNKNPIRMTPNFSPHRISQ